MCPGEHHRGALLCGGSDEKVYLFVVFIQFCFAFKRFHDALSWALRHSVRTELQSIEHSLSQGIDKLSTLPQNLDEVAEANQTQLTLARSSKQTRERINELQEKDQLLRWE